MYLENTSKCQLTTLKCSCVVENKIHCVIYHFLIAPCTTLIDFFNFFVVFLFFFDYFAFIFIILSKHHP